MVRDRRRFLAGVGSVACAVAAGCLRSTDDPASDGNDTGSNTSDTEIPSDAIDITDEGADSTGERPIDSALESAATDGAVLHFPRGTYRLEDTWEFADFGSFEMFGPEATIVPPEGFDGQLFRLKSRDRPATFRIEGFEFDLTAEGTGGRVLDAQLNSELVVRDLSVTGTSSRGSNVVRLDVTDPDGTGLVERLSLPDGAVSGPDISGCYIGNRNRGDIRFVDCHIEGFPDNGLYADPPGGRMLVEGGEYANNGVSSVRVRPESVVDGVHVRCDRAPEGFGNMRGIRLSNYSPEAEVPPAVVKNCTVELTEVTGSDGAIELAENLPAGEIYDTQIRLDVDGVPALRAKAPAGSVGEGEGPTGLRCENVRITGSGGREAAIYIDDRDDCRFESLCVHQTGRERNGIELIGSDGNVVRESFFDITGEPILLRGSTMDVSSFRTQPIESDGISPRIHDCG
ncbi:MAG: hypothetical protein ACOCP2_02855 [Halohasta sp.]